MKTYRFLLSTSPGVYHISLTSLEGHLGHLAAIYMVKFSTISYLNQTATCVTWNVKRVNVLEKTAFNY